MGVRHRSWTDVHERCLTPFFQIYCSDEHEENHINSKIRNLGY